MSLQRVAFTNLLASTIWTSYRVFPSASRSVTAIPMQLSLWTLLAHPMHTLLAGQGSVVWKDAIFGIALIVPFKQQLMFCCFKSWVTRQPFMALTAPRTTAALLCTPCNLSLPLMAAGWTLPCSPEAAARKHLLRCFGILVLIPVLDLSRCFSSKRVVLAKFSPFTIWAFTASCAAEHTCLPDMRASCWTVGAGPHDFRAAVWLHHDVANHSVVVRVPLLLQLGAELTDVWQV